MEDIVAMIAEQIIREAMRNGEFDDLPGKGKPLRLEDLSHVPEELRAGFLILKNAGILPEELQFKKEIISLENLVNSCPGIMSILKQMAGWNQTISMIPNLA